MLMAFWEVQRLTREITQLQYEEHKIRMRLSKYQKYAGRLGGTENLTMGSIAGISSELVPRAMMFSQYADQASSMSAMQNLQMMKMQGMVPWTGNQMTQYQYEMSAFARFKQESMKALKEQEKERLQEIEKEIELELNEMETRIKMKQAALDSTKQLLSKQVTEMVPKFGLG